MLSPIFQFELPTTQLRATTGAMGPARLHGTATSGARVRQSRTASRTEGALRSDRDATLWADLRKRVAQNEIQNDTDPVGDENAQQGPHHVPHSSPAGVTVYGADQQRIHKQDNPHQGCETHLKETRPCG